jgi:hypothetical protein
MHFGQATAVSKKAAIKSAPVSSPPTRRRRFSVRAAPAPWRGFSSQSHMGRTITSKPLKYERGSWAELSGLGASGLGANDSPMGFNDPEFYTPVNYPQAASTTGITTGSITGLLKSGLETVKAGVQTYFDYKVQKTAADVAEAQLKAGSIPYAGVTPTGVNPGSLYYPYSTIQRTATPIPTWVYAAGGGLLLLLLLKRR